MNILLENREKLTFHQEPIVFYDGKCPLCNRAVNWIIENDKNGIFYYKSLDSLKHPFTFQGNTIDSLVLYENNKYYIKSNAVIMILKKLPKPFLAFFLQLWPFFIREFIYDKIAKNRHFFFKKSCSLDHSQNNNKSDKFI